LPQFRMFTTSIHPIDMDVDPKQENEAATGRSHDLESTSAATSK
jgi:hypothetical protein